MQTPDLFPIRFGPRWLFADGTTTPVISGGDGPLDLPPAQEEDLSGLSEEDLNGRKAAASARVDELLDGELTDEVITEIENLGAEGERISAEEDRRSEAATARQSRLDQALAKIGRGPAPEEEVPAEGEVDEAPAEGAPEPVPVAAAAKGTAALVTRAKGGVTTRPRGSAKSLVARRPASMRPQRSSESGSPWMEASAFNVQMDAGQAFGSTLDLASAMCRKRNSWSHIPEGVHDEKVYLAQGAKTITDPDGNTPFIGQDAMANFSVLRNRQVQEQALVASGAFCTPLTPLYDFFRLAEPQTPIEDRTPSVQAPRGGIRYIVPPDYQRLYGAVGTQLTSQNTDPANPVFKPCLHVDCPVVQEATVAAVSTCVTFGNLQYKTFPEQVEAFMEDLAVAFASTKETNYLNTIDAGSTAVTSAKTYGATRSLMWDLAVASVAYRKRHGMKRGSMLYVDLPDWSLDLLKVDMVNNQFPGPVDALAVTDQQVEGWLTSRGLDVAWYNDTATNGGSPNMKFNGIQIAGVLNPFPATVVWYMYAPGTWTRMDGGTLDVGLVRDSTLNRTNDLQMFMEEWTGMIFLGLESIKGTSTVCASGAAPAGITPATCP